MCVCICQCVCMFESGPNVRDCAYVRMPPSVYCHRKVSERVKQPMLKQELSPRWLSDASVCVCVCVLVIPQVFVCVCVCARGCLSLILPVNEGQLLLLRSTFTHLRTPIT